MPKHNYEVLPIVVQDNNVLVDATLLHHQLTVKTKFSDWIKSRISRYGFEKDRDYFSEVSEKSGAGRKSTNYFISLDMAKELAMLEENEVGRSIRRYFIEKEKELRAISHLPAISGLFTALKASNINGRKMYPYKTIKERCGYSTKASSTSGHKRSYPQHFVLSGKTLLVTEEFARHLYHQKQVANNRQVMRASQPVLPMNFGEPLQIKGGGK